MRTIHPFLAAGIAYGLAFTGLSAVHAAVAHLEQAAAEQCASQDFPPGKAVEMMAWCHEFTVTRSQFGRY